MTQPHRRQTPMPYSATLMTADELLELDVPDKRTELVRGHLLVREPPGGQHADVMARVVTALSNFDPTRERGRVVVDPGFTLARGPDTVRSPDVAFVSAGRLPGRMPVGYIEVAPDIAIEILSPSNRRGEMLGRIGDLLDAGARLVWVIDPRRRLARVYRADGSEQELAEMEALDGEDVLPGFRLPLASLLD